MMRKNVIGSILMLLLFVTVTQAQEVPTVSKFSFSDGLTAGDKFRWEVSSTYSVQDPAFKDGSIINLEILADLAGVEFNGDLQPTDLTNYFDLDFGGSSFISEGDAIHAVVFPTSVTLENGTTIDPWASLWVNVLVDRIDYSDTEITFSTSTNGNILTAEATIKHDFNGAPATSHLLAKLDMDLGLMQEYNLDLDLPVVADQELDVVKVEITDEQSSQSSNQGNNTSSSDEGPLPVDIVWAIGLIALIPITKRSKL